jgi:hypothetical protein
MRPAILLGVVAAVIASAAGCGHESVAGTGGSPPAASVPESTAIAAGEAVDLQTVPDPEPSPTTSLVAAPPSQETKPQGQRPPADRLPARPGEAEKITFDDLNLGMAADMVYRPFLLTDRVKQLEGKRLSILGYMHPGVETRKNIKKFILLKNTECKFGPGGQADHLAEIYMAEGNSTVLTSKPVKVEATLKIEPFQGVDGNTWSIYRLEDAKIVP